MGVVGGDGIMGFRRWSVNGHSGMNAGILSLSRDAKFDLNLLKKGTYSKEMKN